MYKRLTGSSFLLISAAIYGLFGIFSRYTNNFPAFSQGWVRYSIILIVISLSFLFKKATWKKVQKKDIKWFLIWILPASFQPIVTFIAFNHLPLGIAYFLIYSTMILGGVISGKIFFFEKLNPKKILSLVLVFIGLFLIYRSDITLIKNIYVLLALVSGLLVGFWNTLTKKVSGNYSEFQMMTLDGSSTVIVGLIGSFFLKETLPSITDISSWVWIFVFALANIGAGFLLIKGFKYIEAQVGSLIVPTEIIFAAIFGYLFFGEILKINIYLGGFFILIGALLPAIEFSNKKV